MSFKGHILPIILITLASIGPVKSQTKKLKVGDKFPDIDLKGVINYKDKTVNLSSLKGKLIILDIWSNSCGSCMNAMPHLQELQDKFGDKIQIFTVNPFSPIEDVISVIKNNKVIKDLRLPCITDTLLNMENYFEYNSIPTEIWIDQTGGIVGVTNAEYVNESNIKALLDGKMADLTPKLSADFDPSKQLLKKTSEFITGPVYYSVLTKKIDGDPNVGTRLGKFNGELQNGLVKDTLKNVSRTFQVNSQIPWLYLRAYNKEFPWARLKSRMIIETSDSSRFFFDRTRDKYHDKWSLDNQYCYEAVLPFDTSSDEYYSIFRQDLNRYLNLNGRVESRSTPVWLVVKNKNINMKPYVPSQSKYKAFCNDYKSLKDLVLGLNELSTMPIVNEVESNDVINVKFSSVAFSDIKEVKAMLKSIGLDIIPSKRVMPMLVISEKNKQITK